MKASRSPLTIVEIRFMEQQRHGVECSGIKTYQGSCHCGAIQFEAAIDLSKGTVRCNCSICMKLRCWSAIVSPTVFRLIKGAEHLSVYRCHSRTEQHLFCKYCGTRPYGIGDSPRWGEFYSVSIVCLDDLPDEERAALPITYLDGRNDHWAGEPADVRAL
jgi:hypothetical protein